MRILKSYVAICSNVILFRPQEIRSMELLAQWEWQQNAGGFFSVDLSLLRGVMRSYTAGLICIKSANVFSFVLSFLTSSWHTQFSCSKPRTPTCEGTLDGNVVCHTTSLLQVFIVRRFKTKVQTKKFPFHITGHL